MKLDNNDKKLPQPELYKLEARPPSKHPLDEAGFFNRLFFGWMYPYIWSGYVGNLEPNDMPTMPSRPEQCENITYKLQKHWDDELQLLHRDKMPSLVRAVIKTYLWRTLRASLITIFAEVFCKTFMAFSVGQILLNINMHHLVEDDAKFTLQDPLLQWTIGLILSTALWVVTAHYYGWIMMLVGLHLRAGCSHLIYRKALKLSQDSLGKSTIGQMVNLLSNDMDKFNFFSILIPFLWAGPMQLILSIALLWPILGPACFGFLILLVLFVPFQCWICRLFASYRGSIANLTDKRVRLVNEIICALRLIKTYAWEYACRDAMEAARKEETDLIFRVNQLKAFNYANIYVSGKMVLFMAVLFHILVFKKSLDAQMLFVCVAMLNNVQFMMTRLIPHLVSMAVEACISLRRICDFLLFEEKKESPFLTFEPSVNIQPLDYLNQSKAGKPLIRLKNVSASWSGSTDKALNDINLTILQRKLTIICGPVASGKSSLILALLNELQIEAGHAIVRGKLGYASQQAWIFAGTVRENILFGSRYEHDRYWKVVKVCDLTRDLELFEFGDESYINDKGNSLSGGQKARISLARCLYKECDVYLLDDPLSAVDPHVAKHIFEEAIKGFLSDKAVLLATHQLHFLKQGDEIVVMDHGKSVAIGTYEQLESMNIDYLLRTKLMDEKQSISASIIPEAHLPPVIDGTEISSSGVATGGKKESNEYEIQQLTESFGVPQPATESPFSSPKNTMSKEAKQRFLRESHNHSSFDRGANSNQEASSMMQHHSTLNTIDQSSVEVIKSPTPSPNKLTPALAISGKISSLDATGTKPCQQINQPTEEGMSREFASPKVWWDYYTAGSVFQFFCVVILFLLTQLVFSFIDVYLTVWTIVEQQKGLRVIPESTYQLETTNSTVSSYISTPDDTNSPVGQPAINEIYLPLYSLIKDFSTAEQALIYGGLMVLLFVLAACRNSLFWFSSSKTAIILYRKLFNSALFARLEFFDRNPIGRFLNRATRDMGLIDELLPLSSEQAYEVVLQWLASLILVAAIDVSLILPSGVVIVMFFIVHKIYLKPARDIQRLEGMARSPIFSHLSTSLNGLATIRATGVEDDFERKFIDYQDSHSSVFLLFLGCNRWLAVILDWLNCGFISVIALYSILSNLEGPSAGLIITNGMLLCGIAQMGILRLAETESMMTSIERVTEYCQLPQEDDYESSDKEIVEKAPKDWPSKGSIEFRSVDLYYDRAERPVLKNLTFHIKAGEKVGIVGRTGAGKSSILTTLFRLHDFDGNIIIDGIDTKTIGLKQLRSSISIIPQDPVLFTDTVRHNLDPFNSSSDEQVWNALELAHLKQAVLSMNSGLQSRLSEGGGNLSVGQRQLMCLARALLKQNHILVMDEATANVDPSTDEIIQTTVRSRFADWTVLIIAHRLNTIIDCDRIIVMDAGKMVEMDEPHSLLNKPNSTFASMVAMTGKASEERLRELAREAYSAKRRDPSKLFSVSFDLDNGDVK